MERRKSPRGSLGRSITQGHAAALYRSGARGPAGVGVEHAQTDNRGLPGTLGDPVVSSATSRPELPGDQLPAAAAHSSAAERKERVNAEVPPSEGNEARREGRQEVAALW
jgi:hypothetical protein